MSTRALSNPGRRMIVAALAGACTTGCFGSFAATRWLYDWNDSFDSKWLKWLVFLVLSILPVYGLFVLADSLVINSIEFWTGSNPMKVGETKDGTTVVRKQTGQENLVALEFYKEGQLDRTLFARRAGTNGMTLLDESGKELTEVRTTPEGGVQIVDGDGSVLIQLGAESADAISKAAARDGQSLAQAVRESVAISSLDPSRQHVGYL